MHVRTHILFLITTKEKAQPGTAQHDLLALANSVCLRASSRSDRHALGLLLCQG